LLAASQAIAGARRSSQARNFTGPRSHFFRSHQASTIAAAAVCG
jgi:hypothetical protein